MKELAFKVLGIPTAKQSFKIGSIKTKSGHTIMTKRTPEKMKNAESNMNIQFINQLPSDFHPISSAVQIAYCFKFPLITTQTKKIKQRIIEGKEIVYKDKKPDIDNLLKLCNDAMNGVVFLDDSQIVSIVAKKIFAETPGIDIFVREI